MVSANDVQVIRFRRLRVHYIVQAYFMRHRFAITVIILLSDSKFFCFFFSLPYHVRLVFESPSCHVFNRHTERSWLIHVHRPARTHALYERMCAVYVDMFFHPLQVAQRWDAWSNHAS